MFGCGYGVLGQGVAKTLYVVWFGQGCEVLYVAWYGQGVAETLVRLLDEVHFCNVGFGLVIVW